MIGRRLEPARATRPIFAPLSIMIQRKQSLFLLAAAVCALLTFIFPVARYGSPSDGRAFVYSVTGVTTQAGTPVTDLELKFPLAILFLLIVAVMAVILIFYKNRPRQISIVRASYL